MSKNLPVKNIATLEQVLDSQSDDLAALLPPDTSLDFMRSQFISACAANPKLLTECTQSSLVQSIREACTLGLLVFSSLGEAWIIPYKNRATFIPGYKGLVKLAYNSGMTRLVESRAVFSNDSFELEYGLEPKLRLVENYGNRGVKKGVYCKIELMTGGTLVNYMTIDQIEEIHSKSSAYNYFQRSGRGGDIWGDDHNRLEMDKKAVWINTSKWIPRSGRRLALALDIDNRQYTGEYDVEDDAEQRLYAAVGAGKIKESTSDNVRTKFEQLYGEKYTHDDEIEFIKVIRLMGLNIHSISDIYSPESVSVLAIIQRAEMLHRKNSTPEENNDRVLRFFRFCLFNQYAITTTREVDDARSAFIEFEREGNAG